MISFRMRNIFVLLMLFSAGASASGYIVTCYDAGSNWSSCLTPIKPQVGASVPSLGIKDQTSGDGVKIPISSAPQDAIPAPSAPSTATQIPQQSQPYSGYGPTAIWGSNYVSDSVGWPLSCQQACTNVAGAISYDSFSRKCTLTSAQCTSVGYTSGCYENIQINCGAQTKIEPASCPPGYVVSGSNCNLSDSRAVTPDNAVDLSRTPNGASPDTLSLASPDDVDPITVDMNITSPTNAHFVGHDDSGNWKYIDVSTQSSGGTVVTEHQQITDSSGNSGVQISTTTINSNGVVQSVSQSTVAGALTVTGSGATSSGSVVSAPSGSTFGGSRTGAQSFPSDYARTGEAVTAAQSIVNSLDGHLNNSENILDPVDLAAADSPGYGTTFDSIKNWSVPTHISSCPQPSMDLSMVLGTGHVYTMSAHCQLVQDNFATLRTAMLVCWSIAALFVVLRA